MNIARHDCPFQLDQDTMIAIDTVILENEGCITNRELQLELENDILLLFLMSIPTTWKWV